jgi:hypothetical protein
MRLSPSKLYIAIVCTAFCITAANGQERVNWQELVLKWNSAHDSTHLADLNTIYDDTVLYYGRKTDREKCIKGKRQMLRKYRSYLQTVSGSVTPETVSDAQVKCSFSKHVVYNGVSKDFPSYLVYQSKNGRWLVMAESDEVTDKNLAHKAATKRGLPKDAVEGDYNGDGKKEYMWLVAPQTSDSSMDCIGDCDCFIRFSDSAIPSITVHDCIGGLPTNRHDLNENGTDEIGLLPDWFTSCWHDYCVWTFIKGKWQYAVTPFSTHCEQWDNGIVPIEKDKKHPGKAIIRYMEIGDGTFKLRQKSVSVVK